MNAGIPQGELRAVLVAVQTHGRPHIRVLFLVEGDEPAHALAAAFVNMDGTGPVAGLTAFVLGWAPGNLLFPMDRTLIQFEAILMTLLAGVNTNERCASALCLCQDARRRHQQKAEQQKHNSSEEENLFHTAPPLIGPATERPLTPGTLSSIQSSLY